jgi:hypothetical protein
MTAQNTFEWCDPDGWPIDTPPYVFLARAVDEVGHTLFSEDWRPGFDITRKLHARLPVVWHAEPREHDQAYELIRRHRPNLEAFKGRPRKLTGVEWNLASVIIAELNRQEWPSVERSDKVKRAIISGAQAEKLCTAVRPVRGGQITEAPSWWWNSERISNRFSQCQLNPNDLFGDGVAGDHFSFIFVTRDSLTLFCKSLSPSDPVKQTIAIEKQCQDWLEQQFLRSEAEGWPKKQFQLAAAEKFGGALAAKMFIRAWNAATAKPGNEHRRQSGRKPIG